MVAIEKLFLVSALAAAVSAYPVAADNSVFVKRSDKVTRGYSEELNLAKRDNVPSLPTLLSQAGAFISSTINNLSKLDISTESDSVSQLLLDVNNFLSNLEDNLKSYTPTSGLGSNIQALLIQTGLQGLLFGLSTIVANLSASILKAGGTPSPDIQAQIQALQAHISNLEQSFKNPGLLNGVGDVIRSLTQTLKNIVGGL